MTRRWLFVVVALNLVVLVALAFLYLHLMVSPGPVAYTHLDVYKRQVLPSVGRARHVRSEARDNLRT